MVFIISERPKSNSSNVSSKENFSTISIVPSDPAEKMSDSESESDEEKVENGPGNGNGTAASENSKSSENSLRLDGTSNKKVEIGAKMEAVLDRVEHSDKTDKGSSKVETNGEPVDQNNTEESEKDGSSEEKMDLSEDQEKFENDDEEEEEDYDDHDDHEMHENGDLSESEKLPEDEVFEDDEEQCSTEKFENFKRPLDESFLSSDEASFGRSRLVRGLLLQSRSVKSKLGYSLDVLENLVSLEVMA